MYAIEFKTHIENGQITVPEVFRSRLFGSVRVLVLVDGENGVAATIDEDSAFAGADESQNADEPRRPSESLLAYRLRNPYPVTDFRPLTREEVHERRVEYKP